MAELAALLDLASRRNEARTLTIRVEGADWSQLSWRQQVRTGLDVSGPPVLNIGEVQNANAEGFYVVGVAIENGVPVTTVRLRYNMTTMRDQVPYFGSIGENSRFSHAIQVGGVTRLAGDWWAVASAIDSDSAPDSGDAGKSVFGDDPRVTGTVGLKVVENQVVAVRIDGVEQVAALIGLAKAEADRAAAQVPLAAAQVALATAARNTAEVQSIVAGQQAQVARDNAERATTARSASETAAAVAGQYRQGIEQAVAGLPADAILPLQAVSLAALAAFPPQAAGRQAYLSEAGRSGIFEWVGGNQSALVATDPDHALVVAPGSQPTGSSGVWRRIHDGFAESSWTRVAATTAADANATYPDNYIRLIGQPSVERMRLRAGAHNLKFSLEVPQNKGLCGAGIGATLLRPTDDFVNGNLETPGRGHRNALVCLVEGGRQHVSDLSIDGRKAPKHVNGINAIQTAPGATAERLHIKNIPNYAVWSVGQFIQDDDTASMSWRDILVENSHIAFESQSGCNVLFERCHYRVGDGDIETGSMFHPYAGCRHVTYRDCTGIGPALNIITIVGDVMRDCSDITFDNVSVRNTLKDAIGIVATCYSYNIKRVRLVNCDLEVDGIGLLPELSGDLVADFHFIGGRFTARAEVFTVRNKSRLWLDDLYLKARPNDASAQCLPILSQPEADVRINGGTWDFSEANLNADGSAQIGWPNAVTVIAQPKLIGNIGFIPPWGVGHETSLTLQQDGSHPPFTDRVIGTTGIAGNDYRRWLGNLRPGVYQIKVRGTYRRDTPGGLGVAFQAYGASYRVTGTTEIASSDMTFVRKAVVADSDGAFAAVGAQTPDAATSSCPFSLDLLIDVRGEGLGFQLVANGFPDGDGIIEKGSTMWVKRII